MGRDFLLILVAFTLICGACAFTTPTPEPLPMKSQLKNLPAAVKTRWCEGSDGAAGSIAAYQFPGLTPKDNSAGSSMRGEDVFRVPFCTELMAVGYAWSSWDHTYYVKVKNKAGLTGWMPLSYLNFGNTLN